MVGIGIDFGTSNSAIAWYDGKTIRTLAIEPGKETMPTVVHISDQYASTVGSAAIKKYIESNVGRRVELTSQLIGFTATSVEQAIDGEVRTPVYGNPEDHGLPGRLFQSLKRVLGEISSDRVSVFGKKYRLVALITPILQAFRSAMDDRLLKELDNTVYVGRPVEFEGSSMDKNKIATTRLAESFGYAGLNSVEFYYEPVAATLSFIRSRNITERCKVLAVDFGGGTLDVSLIEVKGKAFNVLGTKGLPLGGDIIDKQLYQNFIMPELGKGIEWCRVVDGKSVNTKFPFENFEEALLNWSMSHTLNQNKYLSIIESYLKKNTDENEKIFRLKNIILNNLNYAVFRSIRSAKESLSEVEASMISVPEIDLSVPITRTELNVTVETIIKEIKNSITFLLCDIGISESHIDYVIRTGGSSRLSAFEDMLESLFPGKVELHEIYTSVASGLAIASHNNLSK